MWTAKKARVRQLISVEPSPSQAAASRLAGRQIRSECARYANEIGGEPNQCADFHPAWLSSTVVAVADKIRNERTFNEMPILADALEDAGCTNADILNHCRQQAGHVFGCWVLESIRRADSNIARR